MEEKIKDFLGDTFFIDFEEEVSTDADLFKNGLIDSFGYMQILGFLEEEFDIVLSDEEMLDNILISLDQIVRFVEEKASVQ